MARFTTVRPSPPAEAVPMASSDPRAPAVVGLVVVLAALVLLTQSGSQFLLIAVSLAGLWFSFIRAKRNILDPGVIVGVLFVGYYGIRSLALQATIHATDPSLTPVVNSVKTHYLDSATKVALLAVVCFYSAYLSPVGRVVARSMPLTSNRNDDPMRFVVLGRLLTLGGSIALIPELLSLTGRNILPPQLSIVSQLAIPTMAFGWTALVWGYSRQARGSRIPRGILVMVVAEAMAFALFTNFRYQAFAVALLLIAGVHYARKPIRPRTIVIVLLLLHAVLFPLVQASRNLGILNPGSSRLSNLTGAFGYIGSYSLSVPGLRLGGSLTSTATDYFKSVSRRLYGMDTLVAVVAQTPSPNRFIAGDRAAVLLRTVLLPRIIDQNRDTVSISEYFKDNYWGSLAGDYSNQKPGFIGELYMWRGSAAIAVGVGLFGLWLSVVSSWVKRNADNPVALGFLVLTTVDLLTFEDDVVLLIGRLVQHVILSIFVLHLARGLGRVRRTHY